METKITNRGFAIVEQKEYTTDKISRLIQESSAVGPYEDSLDKPGSSYLWVGENHHLNREEIEELVDKLNHWLKHGVLPFHPFNKENE